MKILKLKNSQAGFTIIEMLMALVILGIGIMSIVGLQTLNMTYANSSKRQSEGYNWAMDQIEWLLSLDYTDANLAIQGDPVNVIDNDGHILVRAPYTVEWDVADNSAVGPGLGNINNSLLVRVSVRWNDREVSNLNFVRTLTSI